MKISHLEFLMTFCPPRVVLVGGALYNPAMMMNIPWSVEYMFKVIFFLMYSPNKTSVIISMIKD